MENARLMKLPEAQTLSPSSSARRSSDSNSPEFEFWMVRNPSFPQPNLLSADELFVNGVLLPLHLLPYHQSDPPDPVDQPNSEPQIPSSVSEQSNIPEREAEPRPGPELRAESTTALTASKRWKDIFKKGDKKGATREDKEKEKKKERKSQSGATSAELNINIWPFSRSRSAGNGGGRPRMVAGVPAARKVSSAPCSRSNSAGESKSRKWPSSPGRAGVHLGRSSPVWQVRRGGPGAKVSEPVVRNAEPQARSKMAVVGGGAKDGPESRRSKIAVAGGGGGAKARVLNLNVPMCIGYRHHLSCRSDENGASGGSAAATAGGGGGDQSRDGNVGGGANNLFNLRSFFTKKVY